MSLTATLLAALTTAALGSLHCIAMCGPLAAAGCSRDGRIQRTGTVAYLLGRLASYAMVGAVMGALGEHAVHILPISVVQTGAAFFVGIIAMGRGVRLLWLRRRAPSGDLVGIGGSTVPQTNPSADSVKAFWVSLIPKRGMALGLVTGVLPCGLLVAGWALAGGTLHPLHGAAVMSIFALATAPALMMPVLGQAFLGKFTERIDGRWHALMWIALGAWLALRPWLASAHSHH